MFSVNYYFHQKKSTLHFLLDHLANATNEKQCHACSQVQVLITDSKFKQVWNFWNLQGSQFVPVFTSNCTDVGKCPRPSSVMEEGR